MATLRQRRACFEERNYKKELDQYDDNVENDSSMMNALSPILDHVFNGNDETTNNMSPTKGPTKSSVEVRKEPVTVLQVAKKDRQARSEISVNVSKPSPAKVIAQAELSPASPIRDVKDSPKLSQTSPSKTIPANLVGQKESVARRRANKLAAQKEPPPVIPKSPGDIQKDTKRKVIQLYLARKSPIKESPQKELPSAPSSVTKNVAERSGIPMSPAKALMSPMKTIPMSPMKTVPPSPAHQSVASPMSAIPQSPASVQRASPMSVFRKSPAPVEKASPMSVFRKSPAPVEKATPMNAIPNSEDPVERASPMKASPVKVVAHHEPTLPIESPIKVVAMGVGRRRAIQIKMEMKSRIQVSAQREQVKSQPVTQKELPPSPTAEVARPTPMTEEEKREAASRKKVIALARKSPLKDYSQRVPVIHESPHKDVSSQQVCTHEPALGKSSPVAAVVRSKEVAKEQTESPRAVKKVKEIKDRMTVAEQELFDLLNLDPNDENSKTIFKLNERAVMVLARFHGYAFKRTYKIKGYNTNPEGKVFPLTVICALGASMTTIMQVYGLTPDGGSLSTIVAKIPSRSPLVPSPSRR